MGFEETLLVTVVAALVGALAALGSNLLLHKLNEKQALRLALIDKRMQAHQDAFYYVTMIRDGLIYENTEKVEHNASEGLQWLVKNILYLDRNVQKSTTLALNSAGELRDQDIAKGITRPDKDEQLKRCSNATQDIFAAVSFPEVAEIVLGRTTHKRLRGISELRSEISHKKQLAREKAGAEAVTKSKSTKAKRKSEKK